MPFFKVKTACNYAGCWEHHVVEAECYDEALQIAEELAMEDIGPYGDVIAGPFDTAEEADEADD